VAWTPSSKPAFVLAQLFVSIRVDLCFKSGDLCAARWPLLAATAPECHNAHMPYLSRNPDFARRRFLAGGMVAGAALIASCGRADAPAPAAPQAPVEPAPPMKMGTVIGGGRGYDLSGRLEHFVGMVDLDVEPRGAHIIEGIDFLGHGFAPNPVKPHTAVVTEKHGPGCCEIDMLARRVLRKIPTRAERHFYGHGAFSPDGKAFYCTEAVVGDYSYRGILAVRDGESFELTNENFPTHGVKPHDCILVDDGDTLVVTNGGGLVERADQPGSVAYVNVKSGEARRVLTIRDPMLNAGHIAITNRGELVCVSAPRDGINELDGGNPNPAWIGGISFYDPRTDKLIIADDPIRKKMRGETLSVAIHEPSMIVAATNPFADLVTFWDFRSGRLVRAMEGDFKRPRGVSLTLDGRYFALTYDELTHLILINAETLEPLESSIVETSYIAGSHNITYDL
jgi:uncharacterized protein